VVIPISDDQSNQTDSIRFIKTLTSRRAIQGRRKQFESGRAHGEHESIMGVCGRSWSGELCPWSWKLFRIWMSSESSRICYLLYWLLLARCA